jgi:GNAT superfamily N-acetyltransferase
MSDSNAFVIEEVTDLDAGWPELTLLFLELHDYHEPFLPRRLRDDWEQRWRDFVKPGEDRLVLLARRSGTAIAYLNAELRRDYGLFDETIGFVDDAYVREEERDKGIGRALLARAEAWFRERGVDELRLNVVAGNKRGVRFWTLSGFQLQSMTMTKRLGKDGSE